MAMVCIGRMVRAVMIVMIVAIVATSAQTFTGTTDSTWNTPANWGGVLPTSLTDAIISNGAAVTIATTPAVALSLNLDGGSSVVTDASLGTTLVPLAVVGAITIGTGTISNALASTYTASTVTAGSLVANTNATIIGGRIAISSISVATGATLNLVGPVMTSSTTSVAIPTGATVVARSSSDNAATIFAQASFAGDGKLSIEGNGVAFTGNSGSVVLNTNVLATARVYRIEGGDALSVSTGRTLELRAPGAILDTSAITIDSGATLQVSGNGTVAVNRGSYIGAAAGSSDIVVNGNWQVDKEAHLAFLSTNGSQISGSGSGAVYGIVSSQGPLTLANVNFESGSSLAMGTGAVLSLAGATSEFTDASITTNTSASIAANNAAGVTLTRVNLAGATFSGGVSGATINVADSLSVSAASTISTAGTWNVAGSAIVTANAPTTITVSDFYMGANASLVANNAVYVNTASTVTAARVSMRGRISSSTSVANAGYYLGGAVGQGVGGINFRTTSGVATESTIAGATFYLQHTGEVVVELTNIVRVTADSWFVGESRVNGQNQGNVFITGSLIASAGATAYLSSITSVYVTGVLAANGGNVNVNGTTSIQGGLVSSTGSNYILVSAGVNGGTNYLEFAVPASPDQLLSSRVEGMIRVEAVGLVAVRTNASATTTNSTWFMPPVGNVAGGLIDIAALGSLVHSGAGTGFNTLSFTGVSVNVQGSLLAQGGPVTFGTFTGADGTTKVGTTVVVGVNGRIVSPYGITVGSAADTTASTLTFTGTSLTSASTLQGNVTVNTGSTVSASGLQVTSATMFLGGGVTQLTGWLRAAAPLYLTGTSTWSGAASLESGNSGMVVISGSTSVTGGNVTTTSATSNSANIDVKSGGSLIFTAGTTHWNKTTAGVATGSVLKVNSGAILILESSTIGTDTNKGDITVDGSLYAAAGTAAAVKGGMTMTGSLVVERGATFAGAALTMSGASSEIVINAHPTKGFGTGGATFSGACTIAGKLVVHLNGYTPSSTAKILVATFGPDATPVSGSFASSSATLEFVDPMGRRLLATAGQVTLSGNKAYYDPSTASNAAAPALSSTTSFIVASLAAMFAIVAAL